MSHGRLVLCDCRCGLRVVARKEALPPAETADPGVPQRATPLTAPRDRPARAARHPWFSVQSKTLYQVVPLCLSFPIETTHAAKAGTSPPPPLPLLPPPPAPCPSPPL